MAIPTWRNVSTGSNASANNLLVNAGNQLTQGISQLGSTLDTYNQKQANMDAAAFDQSLSQGILESGGNRQSYLDNTAQQIAGNTKLSSSERATKMADATAEFDALAGLTNQQQATVAKQKEADAANLAGIQQQQDYQVRDLSTQLGFPAEQYGWASDTDTTDKDVESQYSHLGDSGMNIRAIRDAIQAEIGKISAKELEGILINAGARDWAPTNDNSIEVTRGNLINAAKKYKKDITGREGLTAYNDLIKQQKAQTKSFTDSTAAALKDFTARAGQQNIGVIGGNQRQAVNFIPTR